MTRNAIDGLQINRVRVQNKKGVSFAVLVFSAVIMAFLLYVLYWISIFICMQ